MCISPYKWHIIVSFNLPIVLPNPCGMLIGQQLVTLANEKTSLFELWEERRILDEQCMDLRLFYRDTEQADAWIAKQEVATLLHI